MSWCARWFSVWTVLFSRVGALVTDSGGVLSNPAIVARECAIPSVVATRMGTTLLRDGQLVIVDRTSGTVEILG
jgi:rifampicin phosphotransferase